MQQRIIFGAHEATVREAQWKGCIWGPPVQIPPPVPPAEAIRTRYLFGTHELAVKESQWKGAIWPSVPTPLVASPATYDAGAQYTFGTHEAAIKEGQWKGAIWPSVSLIPRAHGFLILLLDQPEQDNPIQAPSMIIRSASGGSAPVVHYSISPYVETMPQSVDLTIQGMIIPPATKFIPTGIARFQPQFLMTLPQSFDTVTAAGGDTVQMAPLGFVNLELLFSIGATFPAWRPVVPPLLAAA
jgi:hypothetical protein